MWMATLFAHASNPFFRTNGFITFRIEQIKFFHTEWLTQ